MDWISEESVRSWPDSQEVFKILANRICSGLCRGSASRPTRLSKLVAVVPTRSPRSSASSRIFGEGTENDCRMETGSPAVLPGVYTKKSAASRSRAILAPSWPQDSKPAFHLAASLSAKASGVSSFFFASSGLIQGRKSLPCKVRKCQQKIGNIALGINDDSRNIVDGRFFEQSNA